MSMNRRHFLSLALAGAATLSLAPGLALAKGAKPIGVARTKGPKGEALVEVMKVQDGVVRVRVTRNGRVRHLRGKWVPTQWKAVAEELKASKRIEVQGGGVSLSGAVRWDTENEAQAEWEDGGVTSAMAQLPLALGFLLAVGGLVVVAAFGGDLEVTVGPVEMKLSTDGAQGNQGKGGESGGEDDGDDSPQEGDPEVGKGEEESVPDGADPTGTN